MFTRRLLLKLTLGFLLITSCVYSQNIARLGTDDSAVSAAINYYKNNRGENLLLYNGIEYAHAYPKTTGYPFYLTDSFQQSSLVYDGVLYQDVPLAYDLVNNNVVIKNKNNFLIELVRAKVNSFFVKDHFFASSTFLNIPPDQLAPGFYEVYSYSPATVFIKHEKVVQQGLKAEDPNRITDFNYYFIYLNGIFFQVKSSGSLLQIFKDKSNEIKTYVKQNKLSFKKNPENTILEVTRYYARLKK